MADVEISVTGEIEVPSNSDKQRLFQFPTDFGLAAPAAKEWLGQRRENVRPWTTFINTSNFKVPPSLPRLSKRIMRNIEYFQSNYLFVFVGLILYCLLTSPLLLIAVAVSFGFGYHLSRKQGERTLTLLGKEITLAQQYGAVALCSIPLFLWAGAGAAVFWVLGACTVVLGRRASLLYRGYLRAGVASMLCLLILLHAIFIDFIFFFCFYYIGASFFIITLHAAFFNIEAILPPEDSFALLEEV